MWEAPVALCKAGSRMRFILTDWGEATSDCRRQSTSGKAHEVSLPDYSRTFRNRNHTLLGCRQVVRHMVLVHAFGSSILSTPATWLSGANSAKKRQILLSFFIFWCSNFQCRKVCVVLKIRLKKFNFTIRLLRWSSKMSRYSKNSLVYRIKSSISTGCSTLNLVFDT